MARLVTALLLLITVTVGAEQPVQSFSDYLVVMRGKAIAEGISERTIDNAFGDLEPDERVIGFDRRQPEFVQTFDEYLAARVTDFRRQEASRLFQVHKTLLDEIAEEYGVDPEYIVAFWGLETSFGRYQGKYSIIRSLATLGHDPRRSAFFSSELLKALRILDEQHVSPDKFVGAWAGAMGQSQFMPGSFLAYAQDHDGDGRKDIWNNEADVFASIANYLKQAGWKPGAGWGRPVELPPADWQAMKAQTWDTRCRALRNHTITMMPQQWAEQGLDSNGLIQDQPYALILPDAGDQTSFLVGGNFRAILSYNCANKYAVSVGLLADHIAGDL